MDSCEKGGHFDFRAETMAFSCEKGGEHKLSFHSDEWAYLRCSDHTFLNPDIRVGGLNVSNLYMWPPVLRQQPFYFPASHSETSLLSILPGNLACVLFPAIIGHIIGVTQDASGW